jgi:hypothetical protein
VFLEGRPDRLGDLAAAFAGPGMARLDAEIFWWWTVY